MTFLSLKKKYDGRLLVLTYEGPGRLLVNGNRTHDEHARRNAAAHPGGGGRMAQGVGPAAGHLETAEVQRLLHELPQTSCCRTVLEHLEQGHDHSCHWLELTRGQPAGSGPSLRT
jgi:hypothetical protein